MARWQVDDAEAHWDELLERALTDGPQILARDGVDCAVVIAVHDFRRLAGARASLVEHLLSGPTFDDLDIERSQDRGREVGGEAGREV